MTRRFGEPLAPRWSEGRYPWAGAVILVMFIGILAFITWVAWLDPDNDTPKLGWAIGISLALLLTTSAFVVWAIHTRSRARMVAAVARSSPGSLAVGARIPKLAPDVIVDSSLAPQNVVLRVDSLGVALLGIGRSSSTLFKLPWQYVRSIEPVEYVEAGHAFEGLAIERTSPDLPIVVQVFTPSLLFARFPTGGKLADIARRANAVRPTAAYPAP